MSLAGAKRVERPSEHRLGVLFEISIVCHVLCSWFWWVAGVSPVLGVVLVVRLVFGSRVRGCSLFLFLVVLLRGCAGVRGAGCGWFRVRGSMWCVRSPSIIECWWGVGRAGPGFLVSGFAGVGLRPASRVFRGGWACFFPLGALCFFWFRCWSSWSCRGWGVWGVSGWVGVFSPASVVRPGPVWVGVVRFLFGEFDPGSGRTLAACLTHASRTGPLLLGAG